MHYGLFSFEDINYNSFEILFCSLNCLFLLNCLSLFGGFPQCLISLVVYLLMGVYIHHTPMHGGGVYTGLISSLVSTWPIGPAVDPPHASVGTLNFSSGFSNLLLGSSINTGVGILRKGYVASHPHEGDFHFILLLSRCDSPNFSFTGVPKSGAQSLWQILGLPA